MHPTRNTLHSFNILLISTYELGRQPFGLASPAAWLRSEGFSVTCADLAVDSFPIEALPKADLVAFYVPMHTATRLAVQYLHHVRELNPGAHVCFFGLYAPMNEVYLRRLGAETILGGEFEAGLVSLSYRLLNGNRNVVRQPEPLISLDRQDFIVPDRDDLTDLSRYARLRINDSKGKVVGYTEASRGCKHMCRHCPVVPVYNGRFRVVQADVVLADIRQQVAAGAEHITFGDPDFFNGIGHAIPIVKALHENFPKLTYDVTVKIEHLLQYDNCLPVLKQTGCILVTSAVESIDDEILTILDKGHTREDFIQVVERCKQIGLTLNPTFIPFMPWTTLEGYHELLLLLYEMDLVDHVSPIQLAIRLLIPEGSRLMELPETRKRVLSFNDELLMYEWRHQDRCVDELQAKVFSIVNAANSRNATRREIFGEIWKEANRTLDCDGLLPEMPDVRPRATVPYLDEPWYC
jgi:radical SAM superfamily enzyme YgiQ (UPF0313 family)